MKLRQFRRNVRDGFKNTWNHLFMSISSVITLTITLSLCAGFVLFAVNTNLFTRNIEGEVRIFVQFDPEAADEEIEEVLEMIYDMDEVADYEFNTPEEEHAIVTMDISQGDEDRATTLLSATDAGVLPATVTIEAEDVEYVQEIAATLEALPTTNFVSFGGDDIISNLMNLTRTIRNVMILIVGILLILAVFLIQNTIKLTIFARREELRIQKLVGASISRVTMPFIVEGVIIGILGASVPILLTLLGYTALYERLGGTLVIQMLSLSGPTPLVYQIGLVMGLLSIAVSLLGSFFAVSRYALKE